MQVHRDSHNEEWSKGIGVMFSLAPPGSATQSMVSCYGDILKVREMRVHAETRAVAISCGRFRTALIMSIVN